MAFAVLDTVILNRDVPEHGLRDKPWRFRLYALPCAALWLATLNLRFHYFVDCVLGFALCRFAMWVAARSTPLRPSRGSYAAARGEDR